MWLRIVCLMLAVALLLVGCNDTTTSGGNNTSGNNSTDSNTSGGGDGETGNGERLEETLTIVFGTHARYDDDPTWVDPVTGETTMTPEVQAAYMKAQNKVLEDLNVQIVWSEYTKDVQTDVLRSMLAGDPICDLTLMVTGASGMCLGQNVLQPIDDYAYLFEDEEYAWQLIDPIYGHNYLLRHDIRLTSSPLVFNISMLEKVDALKDENGRTIYPTDLYKEGKWTWSTFKDYLTKVDAYYANRTSTVTGGNIYNCYMFARSLFGHTIHSAGGAIFSSDKGLEINSRADLEANAWLKEMYDLGLIFTRTNSSTSKWQYGQNYITESFANGEAVFGNIYAWGTGWVGSRLAERGESMGMVPWPVQDGADPNDPEYAPYAFSSDVFGVVRGVSGQKLEYGLRAFRLYYNTYWMERGGVDTMVDYAENTAESAALSDGFDVYHPEIGEDIVKMYALSYGAMATEMSDLVSCQNDYVMDISLAALCGLEKTKAYSVLVQEKVSWMEGNLATIESALASGKLVDIVAPSITARPVPAPLGGSVEDIQNVLANYITIEDSMDGVIDGSTATVEAPDVNFNQVGEYRATVKAYDSALNEATAQIIVYVYDPNNTAKPTLVVKSSLPILTLDQDVKNINWSQFVQKAQDANGIDLSTRVRADVSKLDTSTEGEYEVLLYVEDYSGNRTEVTVVIPVIAL